MVIEIGAGDELMPTAADGGGEAVSGVRQTSDAVETEFFRETRNQLGELEFDHFHCMRVSEMGGSSEHEQGDSTVTKGCPAN